MKLRHAPSGDGTCLEASEAVRRAARLGSKVIVMGYGFRPDQCRTHLAATQYAVYRGAVLVAGSDYGREGDALLRPAADPHVLTVGSVDQALTLAPFSATGPQVDLVAPGSSILAPSLGPSKSATPAFGHATVSGTGYSATMVGATAAWVTQARRAEPSQVMAVLAAGATDLGDPGRDEVFGSGLVQVEGALSARSPIADKMEPNDDIGWVDGRLLTGGRSPIVMKPLWSPGGRRTRKLQATLSEDDPSDVYRIRMPARSQVLIAVAQAEGDVAIEVRSAASKTIRQKKGILSASDEKPQPGTEGTLVRNRARGFRPVYLVVRPGKDSSSGVARYQVTVTGSPLG